MAIGEVKRLVFSEGVTVATPSISSPIGATFDNLPAINLTVEADTTHFHPNVTIATGNTWTIDADGTLLSAIQIVVNGTLTVNGLVAVLN